MNQSIRMLRLPDVMQKTGFSRSQIYRMISSGIFPRQIQLGDRVSAWIEEEIEQWLLGRINLARGPSIEKAASGYYPWRPRVGACTVEGESGE